LAVVNHGQRPSEDKMSVWERNYSREGMKGKNEQLEWWSLSSPLYGAHVFNDGAGWQWKINSVESRQGNRRYFTKEKAIAMCEITIKMMFTESKL